MTLSAAAAMFALILFAPHLPKGFAIAMGWVCLVIGIVTLFFQAKP